MTLKNAKTLNQCFQVKDITFSWLSLTKFSLFWLKILKISKFFGRGRWIKSLYFMLINFTNKVNYIVINYFKIRFSSNFVVYQSSKSRRKESSNLSTPDKLVYCTLTGRSKRSSVSIPNRENTKFRGRIASVAIEETSKLKK